MRHTWYLAGPMSGRPQFNVPLFHAVTRELRDRGNTVINPAELDSSDMQKAALESEHGDLAALEAVTGETWGDVLSRDVKVVADQVDAVIVLPEWWLSRGARLEVFVATLCGHTIWKWIGSRPGLIRMLAPTQINRGLLGEEP